MLKKKNFLHSTKTKDVLENPLSLFDQDDVLQLVPGEFYRSKCDEVWCCYKVDLTAEKHCQAYCVNVEDDRVEYFFLDGRYDEAGIREHCLVEEV